MLRSGLCLTPAHQCFCVFGRSTSVGLFCCVHLSRFSGKSVTGTRFFDGICYGLTGKV